MPYLSDDQEFGRTKSACRLRLEAMEKGEWIHVLATDAARSSVSRICSVYGNQSGKIFHTRKTPTGAKVWRLA